MIEVDLAQSPVRELNQRLHRIGPGNNEHHWRVINPNGAHAIAVGLTVPIHVEITGHVGYYCAGMNASAEVVVDGHAGTGLAENIMSGLVRVRGNAARALISRLRLAVNGSQPPRRCVAALSSSKATPARAAAFR